MCYRKVIFEIFIYLRKVDFHVGMDENMEERKKKNSKERLETFKCGKSHCEYLPNVAESRRS